MLKAGLEPTEMHFLLEGSVCIVQDETHAVLAELHDGSVYGEMALMMQQRGVASVVAKTICWIGVLSGVDLKIVLQCYEDLNDDVAAALLEKTAEGGLSRWEGRRTDGIGAMKSGGLGLTAAVEPDLPKLKLLHPQSTTRFVWECVQFMLCLWTVLVVPYEIASALHVEGAVLVIDVVIDLLYIADIAVHCRTAVMHRGALITDPRRIISAYFKSWRFLFDVCTAVPMAQLQLVVGGFDDSPNTYAALRLIKLYRMWRIVRFSTDANTLMRVSERSVKVAYPILYLVLIWHYCACLWWLTGRATDGWERNWLKVYRLVSATSPLSH